MGSFAPTRNPAGQSLTADDLQLRRDHLPPIDVVGLFTSTVDVIKQYPGETIGGGVAVMGVAFVINIMMTIVQSIVIVALTAIAGDSEAGGMVVFAMQIMMQLLSMAILALVNAVLMGGYNIMWLRMLRGEDVSFNHAMDVKPFIVPLIISNLIMQVGIMLGMVLLIVPGIIMALGLMMTPFMVIDKNLSAVEALKGSWALMDGYKGQMLLVSIIGMAVNFAGVLMCGLGLLVSVPLTIGALASFYEFIAAPGGAYVGNDDYVTAFE